MNEDGQSFEHLSSPQMQAQDELPRVVPPPRTEPGQQDQSQKSRGEEEISISGSHPELLPDDAKDDDQPLGATAEKARTTAPEQKPKAAQATPDVAKPTAKTGGTAAVNPEEEARSLREQIEKAKAQQEIENMKREPHALCTKPSRTVEEEIAIKARTDAAVVAESLPENLAPFRGRTDIAVWLTQVLAMLPKKLRQAIDGAMADSQIKPVWKNLEKTDQTLCETQDRRLYGLVLGALVSKDIEPSSQYDAKQLFVRIHNNKSDVEENIVQRSRTSRGWRMEAQKMKARQQ